MAVAPTPMATAQTAQPALQDQEFSIVPAESPLYNHLQVVRSSGWAGKARAADPSPQPLSRYEMALETAKAVFTVGARHRADSKWAQKADREAARSLHALVKALTPELTKFDIAVTGTLQLLKNLAASAGKEHKPASSGVLAAPTASVTMPQDEFLTLPLSQRLRVYGAIGPLAREQQNLSIPHNSNSQDNDAPNIFSLKSRSQSEEEAVSGTAAVALNLTDRLRLHTAFEQRSHLAPPTLQSALMGSTGVSNFFAGNGTRESSLSGGLDLEVTPGLRLSGSVARVETEDALADGTRFEGGIGLTGWQNRVALSAHLSHLAPEDSMALGLTAAQFNLGIEVTRQIQLRLLYQQMLGAPEAAQNNRIIGGGINIRF